MDYVGTLQVHVAVAVCLKGQATVSYGAPDRYGTIGHVPASCREGLAVEVYMNSIKLVVRSSKAGAIAWRTTDTSARRCSGGPAPTGHVRPVGTPSRQPETTPEAAGP